MTTVQNEERDVTQSHCFDPFPEPRTIPSGWDLSTLLSTPTVDSVVAEIDSAESDS